MLPSTPGMLRPVSASTDLIAAHEKFDFWNEVICRTVVDLDCQPLERPCFEAHIGGFDAPGLGVYDIHTQAHLVYRNKAQIARLDSDALIINYVTEGCLQSEQDGRRVELPVGDAAVSDAERPYFLAFDRPLGCISVKVSKSALLRHGFGIDRITATSLSQRSTLHPLVLTYMRQLISAAPGLSPAAGAKAAGVLRELVAASLQEVINGSAPRLSEHRSVALIRVKSFIEEHLHDPGLDPEAVARGVRLSVRYINQLFAAEETSVGRYIWQRRLDRVAARLNDPGCMATTLSAVALEAGFNNLSHFSRAFRQRFGTSAREYRRNVLAAMGC
jgi:AraC family transcriptional activator of tynA and feaB